MGNRRIDALDGWRGIAILLVLADHYQDAIVGHHTSIFGAFGQHGVTMFFVLSGYLITSRLIARDIDLNQFYLRRFFRLMPVAWSYLLFLACVQLLLQPSYRLTADSLPCLFFYRNLTGMQNYLTVHFWSLSVEEQFYIAWPLLLMTCGKRKGLFISVGAALSFALYRFDHWTSYDIPGRNLMTQVRADALFIGCALALALDIRKVRSILKMSSPIITIPSLAVLVYCVSRFHLLPPLTESIAIAALIAASVLRPEGILGNGLSRVPLTWLGRISYSLYVWQQFFVIFENDRWLLVGVPIFAILSYFCIERPVILFGENLIRHLRTRHAIWSESAA